MITVRIKVLFIIFVGFFCIYAVLRDSVMVKKSIQYEFMSIDNEMDDDYMDSHVRLARAVHHAILGTKPQVYAICSRSNPCGWELYHTPGRQIHGFILNLCKCNANASCVKDHDDVSTYTFQYRCHENITEWDKLAPTADIVADGAVGYGNN